MSDKPKKTLDQIVNDTISSNFGISDADLQLLFEDPPPEMAHDTQPADATPPVEAEPNQEVVESTEPVESEDTTIPDADAIPSKTNPKPSGQGETTPNESSLQISKDLQLTKEQLGQLSTVVQELLRRSQMPKQTAEANQPNPLDEIDDQVIIESPRDAILKMIDIRLKSILPAAFVEYDTAVSVRANLDRFRADHSDFDELRPVMRQIVAENPAANDNPASLPRIYEEAKKRKEAALIAMRKELGVQPTPSTPTPATTATPQPSVEDLIQKVEAKLREKINQRRNASGTLSATQTAPVHPTDRQAPKTVNKPKTEAEAMFDDMMAAGPPSTQFLRGLELLTGK